MTNEWMIGENQIGISMFDIHKDHFDLLNPILTGWLSLPILFVLDEPPIILDSDGKYFITTHKILIKSEEHLKKMNIDMNIRAYELIGSLKKNVKVMSHVILLLSKNKRGEK